MNIQIVKNQDKNSKITNYEVYFKDKKIGNADDEFEREDGRIFLLNLDETILDTNFDVNIKEIFGNSIGAIIIPLKNSNFKNIDWINERDSSLWLEYEDEASYYIVFDFLKWDKSINVGAFLQQLEENLNDKTDIKLIKNEDLIDGGFSIYLQYNSNNLLLDEYYKITAKIQSEFDKIFNSIHEKYKTDYITSTFKFPSEVRTACEQYLIYFAKFLEDLGIKIATSIDSQSSSTFFTIMPVNSDEALSKIRDLLNLYLSLPDFPNLENISKDNSDISAQQLLSNIYHLKSQLALAKSLIDLKDATIESLKFTNYQKEILILENKSDNNDEKTLNGLLTIQEYEYKGLKFNFPEIFRRLKRQFLK